MLKFLCLARVAVEVKRNTVEGRGLSRVDDIETKEIDEAELKIQNAWAWKEEDTDICADEEDEEEGGDDHHEGGPASFLIPALSPEERSHGIDLILKDSRISDGGNETAEKLRLLSPYAGSIALFL